MGWLAAWPNNMLISAPQRCGHTQGGRELDTQVRENVITAPPVEEFAPEDAMMKRIEHGEEIESRSDMSQSYYDNLINLLRQQADSELAGGIGYVPWIAKAPNIEEKLIVANIVKDEMRHAKACYKLLEGLGINVDEIIAQHDYAMRLQLEGAELGTQRASDDKRVNMFYYTIDTWADFIMFNFCMDRAAGHQLWDVEHSSYGPWKRAIAQIAKEEVVHIHHGDTWVRKLALDSATKAEVQAALDKWYPRTMNIFGRPGTKRNIIYRQYGLKQRDNDEVRAAFKAEVEAIVNECGLRMPEWHPDWENNTTPERFGA